MCCYACPYVPYVITFIELLNVIYLISPTKIKNLFFKGVLAKAGSSNTKSYKRYKTKKEQTVNNFHPGVSQIKITCLRATAHQCFQLQVS